MTRKVTALLIALYAILFAFAAMLAVRWPSLILAAGLLTDEAPMAGISDVDWRQVGIAYGGPYLLAAVSFYMAAAMISARRHGSVLWFLMGCAAGFPCVFLIDFEPGWWQSPGLVEMSAAVACILSFLLGMAVWDLRLRPARKTSPETPENIAEPVVLTEVHKQSRPKPERRRWQPPPGPMPAAIARQRASFAMHGRKAMLKRGW